MKPSTYLEIHRRAKGVCEGCGEAADHLEIHHMIARSKTPKGRIRELTEVPELLIAVCSECHQDAESYPDTARPELFRALYVVCGYEAVKTAFERVKSSRVYLGFDLPDKTPLKTHEKADS